MAAESSYGGKAATRDQPPSRDLGMGNALFNMVPNPFYGYITAPGALSQPTIQQWRLLAPYPQYDSLEMIAPYFGGTPGATSSYNALVAKFTKRWSRGLSLVVSYARSKAIDDSSETQGWEVLDNYVRDMGNWRLERSISAHDIPNAFASTVVYDLPVGRGKALGYNMNKILDRVVGGWQISSLIAFQNGIPAPFSTNGALFASPASPASGNAGGFQPLDVTSGNAVSVSNPTPQEWFNTAAFSQPCEFCIGTAPRRLTQLRQDGVHNTDLKVSKIFHVTEQVHAELSSEFLNLTNTPQFSAPDGYHPDSTFGQVTGTYAPPRNIQFGLKVTF